MPFQMLIKIAGKYPKTGVFHISGELRSGEMTSNDKAGFIEMEVGHRIPVQIRGVALINRPTFDPRILSLSIDDPGCDMAALEGKIFYSNE